MGLVRAQVELGREVAHDLVVPVVLLSHLLEVLEHFKAVEVEGGLVERPLSNSASLLHLVEFLEDREAAAQEVLSA